MKSTAITLKGRAPAIGKIGRNGRLGGTSVDLVSLTFCASSDILYDILSESRPPVRPLDQVCGTTDPWVAVGWGVVSVMNELSQVRGLSGDYHSSVLHPLPIEEL